MTPLPEASPSATRHLLHVPSLATRFSTVVDAVTIAPRFVRFHPSRAPFFFFFSSSSSSSPRALLYSPRRRNRTLAFSLAVSISLCVPAPLTIVLPFSYPLRCSCRRARDPPCYPSLSLVCSSIPAPWDLARERLSSYIEKSSGREKNWRYLYHPLCSPFLPFLSARSAVLRRKTCVFN